MKILWLLVFVNFILPACSIAGDKELLDPSTISSFEDCVKAGYPVMRSLPPRCAVPGGKIFTDIRQPLPPLAGAQLCKDLCGDGKCQEIVCMGEGCPCAESMVKCPDDCH